MSETESVDTELLVVGGGIAGVTAAIHAADRGARVILVEKSAALGGNCVYSAGNLLQLGGDDALEHLRAMSFGRTPDEVLAGYLSGLGAVRGWLESLGGVTRDADERMLPNCWPLLPGADGVTYYTVDGGNADIDGDSPTGGQALWSVIARAVAERDIDVRLGTRLTRLVRDADRVVGAEFETADGTTRRLTASAGVVLATGGFENSPAMREAYLPVTPLRVVGTPANTGDGIRAAQDVGAALWHMSNFYGFWGFQAPGVESAFALLFFSPRHLMVDGSGRRFLAETGREPHDVLRTVGDVLPSRPNAPGLPVYLVCDSELLGRGPLARFASPSGYRWSDDNRAELDAGWIVRGSSPAQLAERIGVPALALAESIDRYNHLAAAGRDDDFGRPADSMAPVDATDLYAIELWPAVATTSGGPRRDARARVLNESGDPIPGLHAAGGVGGIWGHLTEHGGGLTDGLVFGAIAAREALGVEVP